MRTLPRATPSQVLDHRFEVEVRFVPPRAERGQIAGVLVQIMADGRVHQVGDAARGLRGLRPQGLVEARIEVDGRSLRIGHSVHKRRPDHAERSRCRGTGGRRGPPWLAPCGHGGRRGERRRAVLHGILPAAHAVRGTPLASSCCPSDRVGRRASLHSVSRTSRVAVRRQGQSLWGALLAARGAGSLSRADGRRGRAEVRGGRARGGGAGRASRFRRRLRPRPSPWATWVSPRGASSA